MKAVHIIPVGHSKGKLIGSLKRHPPFQKIYLLLGKDPKLEGEGKARATAKSMEKDLKAIAEVHNAYVDKMDVFEAAKELIKIINKEKSNGYKVMVNTSGSTRPLTIACYLAASMTGVKVYSGLSKYDEEDKPIGTEKTIVIPPFPIKKISKGKMDILIALYGKDEGVNSLEDLILMLKPGLTTSSEEYRYERSRVSYHVNKLKEDGFVESEKSGKKLGVTISKLGEIYALNKISLENKKNDPEET